jgi:hypothetical protein
MNITSKTKMATDEELDAISERITIDKQLKTTTLSVGDRSVLLPGYENTDSIKTRDYLEQAFFLDAVIQKFQQLVGQNNTTFASRTDTNLLTRLSLFYSNKKYADFSKSQTARSRYKGSYPSSQKLHFARECSTYLSIEYDEDNTFWAFIPSTEQSNSIFALLQKSIQVKTPTSYREVIYALDAFRRALDNLFTQEGLAATTQNRANLLSLIFSFSKKLQRDEKILEFIKPEDSSDPLSDKRLVHAAANGYHANILKMFYLYDYYPSNVEEMKMLDAMPYDMLANILGNK